MKTEFDQFWEKFIFFSSLVALVFLITISLFRYYYLIPQQQTTSGDYSTVQQLVNENKELKAEIESLQKKIENE